MEGQPSGSGEGNRERADRSGSGSRSCLALLASPQRWAFRKWYAAVDIEEKVQAQADDFWMAEHSEAILRPERGLEGADRSCELTAFPAPVSGGGDRSEAALAGAAFSWKSTSASSVSCRGSLPPSLSHPPSPDSYPHRLSIPFIQHMEHLRAARRALRSAPGNTMRRSPHLCSGEACFPGRLL